MPVDKTPLTEEWAEDEGRHRTLHSDVVPSHSRASASASERNAGANTPPRALGASARALPLRRPSGFTGPPARERPGRVFSLSPRLMRMARSACEIVARAAQTRGRIRAWVPACKRGSTAYTLGMLLLEAAQPWAPLELMIFATDTDERALALARSGRYPAGAALGMDPDLRARYTFDEGETIRVSESLRESCVFSRHDLDRDPPFPRLDLIVCQRVFHGVPPSQRVVLARRLHLALRQDGLLLAFDRPGCLPLDLFEPVEAGCFRPRKQPHQGRPYLSLGEPSAYGTRAGRARRLDGARATLVAQPGAAAQACGDASDFIRTLGHPLVLCDSQLHVLLMSHEAQRLCEPLDVPRVLDLATLAEPLSGGLDVVSAARRVLAGHEGQDVIVRKGTQTYLARARQGLNGRGVSVAFTDVTSFEVTAARASQQQDRHASLARLRNLSLRLTDPHALYEQAYVALTHHLPGCAAAVILERATHERELDVRACWGLGGNPMSTLRSVSGSRRLIEESMARGRVVSCPLSLREPLGGSADPVARGPLAPSSSASPRAPTEEAPGAPSRSHRASPSMVPHRGIAGPLLGGGEVVGVLVLLRRSSAENVEDEEFLGAVAAAVGDGIARYRVHRRLELELEAISVTSRASTLAETGKGLLRALRRFGVDELQLGEVQRAAPERWLPFHTSTLGGRGAGAVPGGHPPVGIAALTFSLLPDGRGEAWLAVTDSGSCRCLLRLRGKDLRAPDPDFRRGLMRIGELLRALLARHGADDGQALGPSRREHHAELEALYASLPVVVSLHDAAGVLLRINRALNPFDATPGAAVPHAGRAEQRERALLQRLYTEEIPRWIERAITTGEPVRDVELWISERDERRFWLCNFVPLRGADGGVEAVSTVAQDITALRRFRGSNDMETSRE